MAKKKNKRVKVPRLTVGLLQGRAAAMTQQRVRLMHETAQLQGAIQFCRNLIDILEGKAPMGKEPLTMPTVEEIEAMRTQAQRAENKAQSTAKKKAQAAVNRKATKPTQNAIAE